ncbi:MAG TPA: copper-binding protein [Verrucomicrobiota bacterium]|nr:hypothetical protein [Verrucomicrobiales bacterium]HRI14002.1 copper-binding protein [Verrucomicrobiota bacterium]
MKSKQLRLVALGGLLNLVSVSDVFAQVLLAPGRHRAAVLADLWRRRFLVLLGSLWVVLPSSATGASQNEDEAIAVALSVIKADRQEVVSKALQLTDTESRAFWPLYRQYRAEMDQVSDGLLRLVKEYAQYYPNVPEDRARQMLKQMGDLEKKLLDTRTSYLRKFSKILPPTKNLRFAQVENRLDLALRLQLAANVPLVPIEGQMRGTATGVTAYTEGVPGGVIVETLKFTATVAAIDAANRKVTLVSSDGVKRTVKVGPEASNFDQIRLGDQLKITTTVETVVQMARPGDVSDGGNSVVLLAPKGAKPGGVAAGTVQATGTVTAIDPLNRTAMIHFPDGSTQIFPVRDDIDLTQRKVGDRIVFRVAEMIALSVERP